MKTLVSNRACGRDMIHTSDLKSRTRMWFSLAIIASLVLSTVVPAVAQKGSRPVSSLKDEQRIFHVLNRLGFGARPGDTDRVKAIGLNNYIEQQLNPGNINDSVADAKLKSLPTLSMSTAELYEKYPQPGLLLRQLERRGRVKGGANAVPSQTAAMKNGDAEKKNTEPAANANPLENQKYREALRE